MCIELLETSERAVRGMTRSARRRMRPRRRFARSSIALRQGWIPQQTHPADAGRGLHVRHFAGDVVYHTSLMIAKATSQREVPGLTRIMTRYKVVVRVAEQLERAPHETMFEEEYTKSQKDEGWRVPLRREQFVTDLNALHERSASCSSLHPAEHGAVTSCSPRRWFSSSCAAQA